MWIVPAELWGGYQLENGGLRPISPVLGATSVSYRRKVKVSAILFCSAGVCSWLLWSFAARHQ